MLPICYPKEMVKPIMTLWATRVLSLARPSAPQKVDLLVIEILIKGTRQEGKWQWIATKRKKMTALHNSQIVAQLHNIFPEPCMASQWLTAGWNTAKKHTFLPKLYFRRISKGIILKLLLNKCLKNRRIKNLKTRGISVTKRVSKSMIPVLLKNWKRVLPAKSSKNLLRKSKRKTINLRNYLTRMINPCSARKV